MKWAVVLLAAVLVPCLCACSAGMRPRTPGTGDAGPVQSALPDTAAQWFASPRAWQLEHSGVLQLGDTVLPLTGVMNADLERKELLVSILSGFGLKLVALRVTPETREVLYASPAARAIPHFLEQCVRTLRAVFLTFPDGARTCRRQGGVCVAADTRPGAGVRAAFDPQTGFLRWKTVGSDNEGWTIRYASPTVFAQTVFPKKIVCEARGGGYRLTLELQKVEQP